jgi:glycosyltransferase involved in cell wall biosynthesis
MQRAEESRGVDSITRTTIRTLLIVGPHRISIGGSQATVQAFIDELARHPFIRVSLANTCPPVGYSKKKQVGFNPEKLRRTFSVTRQYLREVKHCDAVLVFANNLFAITLVPLLLLLARWHHKPFYLKPIGGDLELYLTTLSKPFRNYLLNILRSMDGVLVQTRQLKADLARLGCINTYYVPGCRAPLHIPLIQDRNSNVLRLIFLSHIRRDKGALILLEALRLLIKQSNTKVICDIYGPIFEEDREEFLRQLEATTNAQYCGTVAIGTASRLIAAYDALVFPTYYIAEGHPGVIIEAMQSGVPVITTQHRAIPELITHGENGLVIPVRDSHALAEAINLIALDHSLRARMGKANYDRGQEFRTDVVVPKVLKLIFPENGS